MCLTELMLKKFIGWMKAVSLNYVPIQRLDLPKDVLHKGWSFKTCSSRLGCNWQLMVEPEIKSKNHI